jgi:5-bromo-4-chloroindolyl phosphate hydrolysis protein
MPAAPSGLHWIAGGAVAAVVLPALAIGVGMPFWIAGGISLLAGGGVVAMMAPRRMFAQLDASGAERGKIEFARELLTAAEPEIARMEEAAGEIEAQKVATRVRHLAKIARDILAAIERDPLRIDRIRRFLTYYLPRSADIAESFVELERGVAPDAERLAATTEMFERLDRAFTQYAADLQDADLDKLDIELKLLKSSLDEDLGPEVRSAAPLEPGRGKTQGKA